MKDDICAPSKTYKEGSCFTVEYILKKIILKEGY
jgi:hypothetical protein